MESYGLIAYTPSCDPEGASCPLNDSLKAPWTHRATRYYQTSFRENPTRTVAQIGGNGRERWTEHYFWFPENPVKFPWKISVGPLGQWKNKRLKLFGITISRRENQVYQVPFFYFRLHLAQRVQDISNSFRRICNIGCTRRMRTRPYVTLKVGPCQPPWMGWTPRDASTWF